jgi:hypothetical protein
MISAVDDLVVEALFASHLQPSQAPSAAVIEAAVEQVILRLGSDGCAAAVALEFGDHPDTAVPRMCWVRRALAAIAALPETAPPAAALPA